MFDIPVTSSTLTKLHYPDKDQLRTDMLAKLSLGMSYRDISQALGVHWTRIWQIVKKSPK